MFAVRSRIWLKIPPVMRLLVKVLFSASRERPIPTTPLEITVLLVIMLFLAELEMEIPVVLEIIVLFVTTLFKEVARPTLSGRHPLGAECAFR